MSSGLLRNKDVLAGGLFVFVGAFAFVVALRYPAGTLLDMGPGYFPRVLSVLLILFGVGIAARGMRRQGGGSATWAIRPLLMLTAAITLFGALVERLGLVPSLVALIFVSAAAGREYIFREVVVLAGLTSLFSVAVFVWGLKMNYPLFTWGF